MLLREELEEEKVHEPAPVQAAQVKAAPRQAAPRQAQPIVQQSPQNSQRVSPRQQMHQVVVPDSQVNGLLLNNYQPPLFIAPPVVQAQQINPENSVLNQLLFQPVPLQQEQLLAQPAPLDEHIQVNVEMQSDSPDKQAGRTSVAEKVVKKAHLQRRDNIRKMQD